MQLGSAATEETKELSPHVDTAADLREFPCLGSGTAVWLGSDMTAACRSIELKLSVLVQVRMEPVRWPGADGLRCDRHFHARRVPPEPVVVKVGSPFTCWSMAVSMQSKAVSLAPQPPLLPPTPPNYLLVPPSPPALPPTLPPLLPKRRVQV